MRKRTERTVEIIGIILLIAATLVGVFFLTQYVRDNDTARSLVEQTGYLGILAISIVVGLNLFLPVPAATFAPVFAAAGLSLSGIIAMLVLGSVIADSIGYLIGIGGRHITKHTHPKLQQKLQTFAEEHREMIVPLVFVYSVLSPFPNEVILIPLAIIGIRYRTVFLPLLAGTIVYETLLAYGLTSTFSYFF
jgi:membrane protein YqaA with SNARE-associated domain